MKIGIDASRAFGDERTGTENYSYQMICHLLALKEAKEHEWRLYVRPGGKKSRVSADKLDVFNLNSNSLRIVEVPLHFLWTQVGLAYSTWRDKLDVLWVPAHTLPILRKPGLKTVVTIHGIEYEWLPAYENMLQRWYLPFSTKYAISAASKVIAVSNFTKEQVVERMKGDSKKIEVVWEGVASKPQITSKPQIMKKYNLDSKRYLLFVGTVQPRKNLARLIKSFSALRRAQGQSIRLVIAGKLGWGYADVMEEARMNPNVIITGYISDEERRVLLENALAYVQPSITEGFGLPVIEAMQAGVPVVSSIGGALREIVCDAGLLFDPYNINDMEEKLRLIMEDGGLRKDLIKKGYERVKEFTWKRAAEETLFVLKACNV